MISQPISAKVRANAHKVAFYMQQYPDKKMNDVMNLLQTQAVYINSAIWAAWQLGYIEEPNRDTGDMKFLAEPDEGWNFGKDVADLMQALLFSFGILALREEDLEENFISGWTTGLNGMDVIVSMKYLLVTKKLGEYELQDQQLDENGVKVFAEDEVTPVMDTYIFYTLFENLEKQWGRKQFKVEPPKGDDNKEGSGA